MTRLRRSVCAEPGCPTLTDQARCTDHTRQVDRARGTRQQRGYDARHDQLRGQLAPLVAQGGILCWRCKHPITVGAAWDLGHDDRDRTVYRGPEHTACNRATAGRN